MMSAFSKTQNRKISEAVLKIVALRGWEKLTLAQVAKAAKIPVAQLEKTCGGTSGLLPLLVDHISDYSLSAAGKADLSVSRRDRVFDLLMARFDGLQEHRAAILSIADAVRRDSKWAAVLLPAQYRAMEKTLDRVDAHQEKSCRPLRALALHVLFLATFRTWKNDETLDMSKTMASLDRHLGLLEKSAILLRRNFF